MARALVALFCLTSILVVSSAARADEGPWVYSVVWARDHCPDYFVVAEARGPHVGAYFTIARRLSGPRVGEKDMLRGNLEGFDGERSLKNVSSNETLSAVPDYHNADYLGVISRLHEKGCDYART